MTSRASRNRFLLSSALVSVATFAFFATVGVLAEPGPFQPATVLSQLVAASVVGVFLTLRASQRDHSTIGGAVAEGFTLAIVVSVANSLFGSDAFGRGLAIRTAALLAGLPSLFALAHILLRTRGTSTSG